MASAGSSCSPMMWRSRLLRMARLAYSQPGCALASLSATRSAQPRTPLGSRWIAVPHALGEGIPQGNKDPPPTPIRKQRN